MFKLIFDICFFHIVLRNMSKLYKISINCKKQKYRVAIFGNQYMFTRSVLVRQLLADFIKHFVIIFSLCNFMVLMHFCIVVLFDLL